MWEKIKKKVCRITKQTPKKRQKIMFFVVGILVSVVIYNFEYLANTYFTKDNAKGELIKVSLTTIAGIGGLYAIYLNYRRVKAMDKGNIDSRFSQAMSLLGNENEAVALGGIYALHQMAKENVTYLPVVHDILCNYIRDNSKRLAEKKTNRGYSLTSKGSFTIQAIIDLLFKEDSSGNRIYKDMKSNLNGSILFNCDFSHSQINNSDFSSTDIYEADLSHSKINNSDFTETITEGANFSHSQINNSDFSYSKMELLDCTNAEITNSYFWDAKIRVSNLSHSIIKNSDFGRSNINQSNFSNSIVDKSIFLDCQIQNSHFIGSKIDDNLSKLIKESGTNKY